MTTTADRFIHGQSHLLSTSSYWLLIPLATAAALRCICDCRPASVNAWLADFSIVSGSLFGLEAGPAVAAMPLAEAQSLWNLIRHATFWLQRWLSPRQPQPNFEGS